jgi:hypothetical protein
MALATTAATTIGNLIDNPAPLPDGTVIDPLVTQATAAGTTQATAAALTSEITVITNNTTANGVILPVGLRGQRLWVYGALAAAGPIVYPPVGGTLNNGTANAGAALVARQMRMYICSDNTGLNWIATA